ncbi:hypothetical protein MMC13_001517 [Lambiella insularis]|nr:hypothetical protein [Lambiella insularis]
MSNFGEQPFNEYEERYFLAEILKNSNLPPTTLLQVIRETGVEPAWTNIALPTGRSVAACQHAYQALFHRIPFAAEPLHKRPRRPPSLSDAPPVTERFLQPRPAGFAPVNGPDQISPTTEEGKPRKKRGRPSKEEHDRRVAEAEARGEVYPKPRKPKTPRPSTEAQGVETVEVVGGGAPTAIMFTPNKTVHAAPASPTSIKRLPDSTAIESATSPAGRVSHEEQRVVENVSAGPQMQFGSRDERASESGQLVVPAEPKDVEMRPSESTANPAPIITESTHRAEHNLPTHPLPAQETQEQQIRPQEVQMQGASAQEEHQQSRFLEHGSHRSGHETIRNT